MILMRKNVWEFRLSTKKYIHGSWINQSLIFFMRFPEYPRIQTCQTIISQIKRSLKKLPQNGEKRSQNGENKAIYASFHKTIFYYSRKVFLSETLFVELPKNIVICSKGALTSLLLGSTKTPQSCLLLLNFKQRISK